MLLDRYYVVLGVPRNESPEGIRRAFREQVKKYHPDRLGPQASAVFDRVLQAYHSLSRRERLQHYNDPPRVANAAQRTRLQPEKSPAALPQAAPGLSAAAIFDYALESAIARASSDLVSTGKRRSDAPEKVTIELIVSRREAVRGGLVEIVIPSCAPCLRCRGSGNEGLFACEDCDGEGLRRVPEILRFRVPANVGDGTLIEAPLRGLGPHGFYCCARIRVVR
ncbi:MAG TPA: DnaJ domain-containing protein [Candidatus Binatia bacterium]|nr:DnaJ domain-containing protein [Candidatus Binatia bacterium]